MAQLGSIDQISSSEATAADGFGDEGWRMGPRTCIFISRYFRAAKAGTTIKNVMTIRGVCPSMFLISARRNSHQEDLTLQGWERKPVFRAFDAYCYCFHLSLRTGATTNNTQTFRTAADFAAAAGSFGALKVQLHWWFKAKTGWFGAAFHINIDPDSTDRATLATCLCDAFSAVTLSPFDLSASVAALQPYLIEHVELKVEWNNRWMEFVKWNDNCGSYFSSLPVVATLKLLTNLDVSCVAVSSEFIASVAPSLELLWQLKMCSTQPQFNYGELARIPRLAHVNVSDSSIGNGDLEALSLLPFLEEIILSDSEGIERFCCLSNLKALRKFVACRVRIDDGGLEAICNSSPLLEELNLWGCRWIEDFSPLAGARCLKNLYVSYTHITDEALLGFVLSPGVSESLEGLCIDYCQYIKSATTFVILASALKCLSKFHLSFTSVDNEGLEAISRMNTLRDLRLFGCKSITNFEPLRNLRSLQFLNVSFTGIDDVGVVAIAAQLPLLNFNCENCDGVTSFKK